MNTTTQDFKKYPSERLEIMLLFLNSPNNLLTSNDISKHLNLSLNKGKNSGGILSSIYRAKIHGESLIIPVEPEIGERRMRWILNKIALNQQLRANIKQAIIDVLTARKKLIKRL